MLGGPGSFLSPWLSPDSGEPPRSPSTPCCPGSLIARSWWPLNPPYYICLFQISSGPQLGIHHLLPSAQSPCAGHRPSPSNKLSAQPLGACASVLVALFLMYPAPTLLTPASFSVPGSSYLHDPLASEMCSTPPLQPRPALP